MALATVGAFVKSAMRKLGALQRGATPQPDEMVDFTDALNLMLRQWSTKRWLAGSYPRRVYQWPTDTASTTIGPTPANFVQTRPIKILSAFISSGGVDYPLTVVPQDTYDAASIKTTSGIPEYLHYSPGVTGGVIYIYPVPSNAMNITLNTLEPFTEYAAVDGSDPIALPVEYHEAVLFNLCIRIAPELGVAPVPPDIQILAREGLNSIRGLRSDPTPQVVVAPELMGCGSSYNIVSDR